MAITPKEVVTGDAQIVFRLAETPNQLSEIELKLNQADLRLVQLNQHVGVRYPGSSGDMLMLVEMINGNKVLLKQDFDH